MTVGRSDGEYFGLLRLSADCSTLSYVREGEWVEDRDLFRYLVNPGCDGPDQQAARVRRRASRLEA
jgi:hypothetical protein